MIFPLRAVTAPATGPPLNSGRARGRPLLSVGLLGAAGGRREFVTMQVDTGADDVLFPVAHAARAGIDLRKAPTTIYYLADGRTVMVAYAGVELTLSETPTHFVRWSATVGFAPIARGLFGFAGGLEFFHLTLDPLGQRFNLSAAGNIPQTEARYPGPAPAVGKG